MMQQLFKLLLINSKKFKKLHNKKAPKGAFFMPVEKSTLESFKSEPYYSCVQRISREDAFLLRRFKMQENKTNGFDIENPVFDVIAYIKEQKRLFELPPTISLPGYVHKGIHKVSVWDLGVFDMHGRYFLRDDFQTDSSMRIAHPSKRFNHSVLRHIKTKKYAKQLAEKFSVNVVEVEFHNNCPGVDTRPWEYWKLIESLAEYNVEGPFWLFCEFGEC